MLQTLEAPKLLVVVEGPPHVTKAELCEAAGQVGILGVDFSLALERAGEIHAGQTRDNGDPFLEQHIYDVALQVMLYGAEVGYSIDYLRTLGIASLMHDSVEDSNGLYPIERCIDEFGPHVGGIVDSVTKRRKGELFQETINRIERSADPDGGRIIKGWDRNNNLKSSLAMLPENPDKARRKVNEARGLLIPSLKRLPDADRLARQLGSVADAIDWGLDAAA